MMEAIMANRNQMKKCDKSEKLNENNRPEDNNEKLSENLLLEVNKPELNKENAFLKDNKPEDKNDKSEEINKINISKIRDNKIDSYENFDINKSKELRIFKTKEDNRKLLALNDGRILSIGKILHE